MLKKSVLYNPFILIWFSFGFLLFTFAIVSGLLDGSFWDLSITLKLKYILPYLIFIIYIIGYIKYKRKIN